MPTTLITGANRGLGLELARQYAAEGWSVHACCREPDDAADLASVAEAAGGALMVHALDVADFAAIDALAGRLATEPIDVLINNAGVYAPRVGERSQAGQAFGEMDYPAWERIFRVNAMAPFKLAEAFVGNLAASRERKLVAISSSMASIATSEGGYHAYRSSKVALNMLMATLAHELAPRGIRVAILSPGWVRTRMGGSQAHLTPERSVLGLRRQIEQLSEQSSGRFLRWDGTSLPW